jgi:cell division septation protein DedD
MRDAPSAVAAWQKLKQQHAQVLGGLSPTFERADLGDKGVYHRVQAGPFADRAAAAAACAALKAAKQDCVVVVR